MKVVNRSISKGHTLEASKRLIKQAERERLEREQREGDQAAAQQRIQEAQGAERTRIAALGATPKCSEGPSRACLQDRTDAAFAELRDVLDTLRRVDANQYAGIAGVLNLMRDSYRDALTQYDIRKTL